MRKLHFWLFFIICIATGIGLGLALRPARSATPRAATSEGNKIQVPPIRGVHISTAQAAADLKHYTKAGINTVIVDSPTLDLAAIAADARKNKMQVYFTPRTSKLVPAEVLAQAKLAAANKVDLFGIGYGLPDTGPDEEVWTKLIADVRKIYSGHFAIVSDLTNYPYITWWDLADVVAVSGPFDLPNRPDMGADQLRAAWNSHLLSLRSLVWRENKGLLMLNVTPAGTVKSVDDAIITAAQAIRGEEWFVGLAIQPPPASIEAALADAWKAEK